MSQPQASIELDVKSLDDDGTFVLYAAVFGNVDRGGDVIKPGAFTNLDAFVQDGWIALNHKASDPPIGYPTSAVQDAKGLRVEGRFHSTPEAQVVRTFVRERLNAGKSVKASIGYRIIKARQEIRDGEPVRSLDELHVYETSIVNLPMNPEADVVSSKSGSPPPKGAIMPETRTNPEPENDEAGLIAAVKQFLGFVRNKTDKGEMPKSVHTRLKAFAEAMHEHGAQAKDHARMVHEHGKKACMMAKEMKKCLKAMHDNEGEDDEYEDDDENPHGPTDRGDFERDDEGDEEVRRPKKGRKGRKPEDTDDANPPKSGNRTLTIFREQLQHRATAGRAAESCP